MGVPMPDSGSIVILGCGGHARSVVDILLANDPNVRIVFVDEAACPDEKLYGFDVVSNVECLQGREYFPATGDGLRRKGLLAKYGLDNVSSIISKRAYVSRSAHLSKGVFIGAGAHIGPFAEIGVGSIVNSCAVVEHEVKVGRFSHIAPNATVSGRCVLGDHVFLGAGSVVKDRVSISDGIVVGAGSVVIKDLVEPGVYAGSPVRRIESSSLVQRPIL